MSTNMVLYPTFYLSAFASTYGAATGSITSNGGVTSTWQLSDIYSTASNDPVCVFPSDTGTSFSEGGLTMHPLCDLFTTATSWGTRGLKLTWHHDIQRFVFTCVAGTGLTASQWTPQAQRLFGLTSSVPILLALSASFTCSQKGWGAFAPTVPDYGPPYTGEYEAKVTSRGEEEWSDDGTRKYVVERSSVPRFEDWSFIFEPSANMRNDATGSTINYTFEQLLLDQRSYGCWSVVTGTTALPTYSQRTKTYQLRMEGTYFSPKQSLPGLTTYWNHDVLTNIVSKP